MKKLIGLLILVLAAVGTVQWVGALLHQHEFEEKLHDVASQVEDSDHKEIKQQVVAEGGKLHVEVAPSDVDVGYAPTSDLGFAQRMVSGIGTFQNHRATIKVDYTQRVLFMPLKRHAEATALIESTGRAKRAQVPVPD